jgi:hypothetical protein
MTQARPPLTLSRIASTWWPLAASWLLMGIELPILTAVVERMDHPDVNLASYGSVVFPLALIVEAPIIMLLAAATALVRHKQSYHRLHRFMTGVSILLTAIHVALAFTPAFDWVFHQLLEAPEELLEPSRIGLRIMTPWTWAIAYRRMQQGVLIRAGLSRSVGVGTLVRLIGNLCAMLLVSQLTDAPGIIVGTVGIATGVTLEAIFSGILVRPVVRELPDEPGPGEPALGWERLLKFYSPLALTPFITLILPLVGSAAMSRMANPMLSLAAWPAVHGLVFLFRGVGMAYNEVVVALVDEPGAIPMLEKFCRRVAFTTTAILGAWMASPLADVWFSDIMYLSPELAQATRIGVAMCLLMPAYQVMQSWFQGVLVASERTRAVPEAVALYSLLAGTLFLVGVYHVEITGLYYAVFCFTCGGLTQTLWLWKSSRHLIRGHLERDSQSRPAT